MIEAILILMITEESCLVGLFTSWCSQLFFLSEGTCSREHPAGLAARLLPLYCQPWIAKCKAALSMRSCSVDSSYDSSTVIGISIDLFWLLQCSFLIRSGVHTGRGAVTDEGRWFYKCQSHRKRSLWRSTACKTQIHTKGLSLYCLAFFLSCVLHARNCYVWFVHLMP